MNWIKIATILPFVAMVLWALWVFHKNYKKQTQHKQRMNNLLPRDTHSDMAVHVQANTGRYVHVCQRCGWQESFIKAGIKCAPAGIPKCDIEYRPSDDPKNNFFCKTHNHVTPNANWCLSATIDAITAPIKF